MKIRCLIVDDEPLAIEVIESHLNKFEDVEIVGTSHDAVSALAILQKTDIDLLFMDIQMPYIKGTDFLRSLNNPPNVIITTAYRDYALEGFELDVLDYLVKPISFERFMKAMNKYYKWRNKQSVTSNPSLNSIYSNTIITIKCNRKMIRLNTEKIDYIESMKDYSNIISDNDNYMIKMSLHALEELLPSNQFLRIHKSYIVSINKISAFTNELIEIADRQLPIGRYYKQNVLNTLNMSK